MPGVGYVLASVSSGAGGLSRVRAKQRDSAAQAHLSPAPAPETVCQLLRAGVTVLRDVFGIVPLDWRAWAVMVPTVVLSSLAGVYMTRWILELVPLWES
jgi:hypothetical protein